MAALARLSLEDAVIGLARFERVSFQHQSIWLRFASLRCLGHPGPGRVPSYSLGPLTPPPRWRPLGSYESKR